MSWAIGFDETHKRDIGYGVPAICDHPDCNKEIHRGLAYVCGGEPWGGEDHCGLHFCGDHLVYDLNGGCQACERCIKDEPHFSPKPDTQEWTEWKLTHESWQEWRDDNPELVAQMQTELS